MSNSKYTLHEVTTPALEQEFIDLPKRLYAGNKYWVCPFDDDIKAVFDPQRNKLYADGEAMAASLREQNGQVDSVRVKLSMLEGAYQQIDGQIALLRSMES